ncbi:MAG TPA: CDP-alcohol phosphatidyltransferase [Paludibacteraceae bacterium]|mgnify:FL=1|nr:CDP-alcohol phosphatidyltransferase family protein [Paludibacteraceae bacterium]MDS1031664.1 CDP-alcohol phosphatidyltransferase [Porphyromonadaceae sp. NP-X]HOH55151.1 CDP-alcohol phosphatidyltransferase [Paludibacteraceae bacterium]
MDQETKKAESLIAQGRVRTNILHNIEQKSIAYLVQKIPAWMSSDMLTAIGFVGSIIVFLSFVLGAFISRYFLLLGILGFMVSWFGDSLDGRIAYYRNKPRKWYGFSLDITVDWLGIILMGGGFIVYAPSYWKIIGFLFVVLYGWEMLTALLRYKVTEQYSIDSGSFGPTEVRILISFMLILEVIVKDSILYTSSFACLILLIMNFLETGKILKFADERDKKEKEGKISK